MKTTAVAAFAALLAVARVAAAGTTGPGLPGAAVDDEVLRATTEARALVATMQNNARTARDALGLARRRRREAEVRCTDAALSMADVALRHGREEAAQMAARFVVDDLPGARAALWRLRLQASASHDAAVAAGQCSGPEVIVDHTVVIVQVDPRIASLGR